MLFKNLYDSHLHLLATGQRRCGLDLSGLHSIEEMATMPRHPLYFRGDWYVGFGWNEKLWAEGRLPTLEEMDRLFPDFPIYFSRIDGHSGIANSKAAEVWGVPPRVLFQEQEHFQNLERLPAWDRTQQEHFLKVACESLNAAGFTHVRDLSGTRTQFEIAQVLEGAGQWNLHLDWNFPCFRFEDFESVLTEALACRQKESPLNHLQGLKFYFDGSLGSGTALVSGHENCCPQARPVWDSEVLSSMIERTWKDGLEVSVHTIGDEAIDQIVNLARKLSSRGILGRLNLEHVEILRPETLQKMKPLHIVCHLQPCHWFGDQAWFDGVGRPLKKYAFPWEALRRAKVPFYFGSDSPIEEASFFRNMQALQDSAKKRIQPLQGEHWIYHQHPAPRVHGETVIENNQVISAKLLL